ncbi:MAG: IS91 family transposase [Gammaproteobacteria bacterium]|nr:MAG: IS91 family transposase [Gammaproteobacteria bacterium]
MNRKNDLQQVLHQFLPGYCEKHTLSPRQAEICTHIRACRTEALGGVQLHCDHCDYEQPWYCACRDRHCPKCQWRATEAWCDKQCQSVLPVTYYHLVFTLPHDLNLWVQLHPEVIYHLLFKAVWATLKAFGADPKRLGGQLGMTAVLHTWGQQLWRHVHLHCLIPGGALDEAGQWHAARSNYLFPDRALSRHFRGRMVSELRKAYKKGDLGRITRPGEVDRVLDHLMEIGWVVYTKPWIQDAETVVAYLARYTHRIAISDARIGEIFGDEVAVSYKDYQDKDRWKSMNLAGEELIRRFLLHILPKGLMRVRHYGYLANRCRKEKLAKIRAWLGQQPAEEATDESAQVKESDWPCPECHRGVMRVILELPPIRLTGS